MSKILPINLYPKFNPKSRIPQNIMNIINDTIKNPVKVINHDKSYCRLKNQISAFNNKFHIAQYSYKKSYNLRDYINDYKNIKDKWENTSFSFKKEIFLKAADLIENKYYDKMLAYTILGQNKTIYEAELDSICELVDFLRFNVYYAEQILEKQPISTDSIKNISEYNSLNGLVVSITPFNFTAIAGNLATAPLLFGNVVLWKPSDGAILSNYLFYEILKEAGLPDGVLTFFPMEPNDFINNISKSSHLAGVLFTGSSDSFENIYSKIIMNLKYNNNFPRLIGETGGKNFHFIDSFSKDCNDEKFLDFVASKTLESAFNYSGQKCSACSIAFVPDNSIDLFYEKLKNKIEDYKSSNENYGVINKGSFRRLVSLLKDLKIDSDIEFLIDGPCNEDKNFLISPHILVCKNINHYVFRKEFFGPILVIYPYDYNKYYETMELCIEANSYALTGSVFSKDEKFIEIARNKFKHKTGNFYINDKSTGAVVGQQPFGGSGKSGTNDKAGDINLLYRLFNQRSIKINCAI